MIEEDMKFITKETMDDTDLLIDIHNSLVYPPYKPQFPYNKIVKNVREVDSDTQLHAKIFAPTPFKHELINTELGSEMKEWNIPLCKRKAIVKNDNSAFTEISKSNTMFNFNSEKLQFCLLENFTNVEEKTSSS